MDQTAYDYYLKNLPAVAPAPVPVPEEPSPPVITQPVPPATQSGGAYFGAIPPDSPQVGWLWVNSANDGIYTYTDDDVWVQTGTNW
jgi:hypothetical protein